MLKGASAGSAFSAGSLVICIACALTVMYSSRAGALETTRRIARLEALHATEVLPLAFALSHSYFVVLAAGGYSSSLCIELGPGRNEAAVIPSTSYCAGA